MGNEGSDERVRFEEYLSCLGGALGHADRVEPLRAYLTGLLLPGERKNVEAMAAKVDPRHVSARHQSMNHFAAQAPWDEAKLLAVARDWALTQMERHGPVEAWVVDDTGIPKKGKHSVGVARQYCGILGKQENCQVAVAVSLTQSLMSMPAAWRLYLPKAWAGDKKRRRKAGVPPEVRFQEKWRIALDQMDALLDEQLPPAPVVADSGYGDITGFREGVTERCLSYVMEVKAATTVWAPGTEPRAPRRKKKTGRPPTRLRRSGTRKPLAIGELCRSLPASLWERVRWREGTRGTMESLFAAVRVRPAHRDIHRHEPREVEWLLAERTRKNAPPHKFWLSTIPERASLEDLVRLAKIRWRVERDFQELKSELGLDHYEGRGWRGFHRHAVLCIAAYAFLAAERARLSPPQPLAFLRAAALPEGFRPRGAPPSSGEAQSHLDRHATEEAES